jgi:purine-nucleoside phosphorylase
VATPHIEANIGDIAEVVLMPGDPLRAKFIAENYLTDVKIFNSVRNMFGYTGYYNGKRVSVMGSGMGMPSIGIYAYELYKFFDVKKIIRIGSCGAYVPELKLFDVILVDKSYSESTFAKSLSGYEDKITLASSDLTNHIANVAKENNIPIVRGTILTSDVFYSVIPNNERISQNIKPLAVEMETFALFHIASILNKEAACILTVSDSIITKEETTAMERQQSLVRMIELALKSIEKIKE